MSKISEILGREGGGKIFEYMKRALGALWHEINVEKWYLG